jgi:hypothetical protein
MIDAQTIAEALSGKRNGKGWRACCPAHGSNNPTSLSIEDADNGMILVHCFGGCTQTEVIADLSSKGLWPKPTPEQRHNRVNRAHLENVEHAKTILMLAEGDEEGTHSEEDSRVIVAARELVAGNTAVVIPRPELDPVEESKPKNTWSFSFNSSNQADGEFSWRFVYHCTTPRAVALNFESLDDENKKAVCFFNSSLISSHGKSYPAGKGGQFIPPKGGKFRQLWMEAVGVEPYRWCIVNRSMRSKLSDLVFTGRAVNAIDSKGRPYLKLPEIHPK